jgi:primosomal protein N' (replication factor Y) (superfamily II helicase)
VQGPSEQFATGRLWIESGDDAVGPVATVAPIAPVEKTYTFRIPADIAETLTPGQRVLIPQGRRGRLAEAFCISIDQGSWTNTLRAIDSVIDEQSFLSAELLELGRWIAHHYACPLGRTLAALVPQTVRKQSGYRTVRMVRLAQSVSDIESSGSRLGPKQRAVLEHLDRADGSVIVGDLLTTCGASTATLRSMAGRGWIAIDVTREAPAAPDFDLPADEPDFELNEEQEAAAERLAEVIGEDRFLAVLLYGVSGSGKTEVYIRTMHRVLDAGRQVILLVPEIALTTQLVTRLASRFRGVAVIHSGLTGVQRSLTWAAIRSGEKRVIIGTRSAVFAPCPQLGLIVVDEEQESSYKNLRAPRFHVRDVAIVRARALSIPVVLGSATPSLESWHNCERFAHFEKINLSHRVRDLPMPTVTVVDVNDEFKENSGIPLVSRVLVHRLGKALERGEQAVILVNRRGFATQLMCGSCGHRVVCPDCAISLVYHAPSNEIVCHYCNRREAAPQRCPDASCGSRLVRRGGGTQRVQERIERLFPEARVRRVDSDTMRHERTYRQVVTAFENRELDVLIGTQIVAKGLDFPHVSFVGVIGADLTSVTDFRASERLFQLIAQVAGRAGRAEATGQVVLQTRSPHLASLRCAVDHDYDAFVVQELELRRKTQMPPFSRLARIVVSDESEQRASTGARAIGDRAGEVISARGLPFADVLGPVKCAMARLRKRYRFEVVLRCVAADTLTTLLDELRAGSGLRVGAKSVVVDVDPVSMS